MGWGMRGEFKEDDGGERVNKTYLVIRISYKTQIKHRACNYYTTVNNQ